MTKDLNGALKVFLYIVIIRHVIAIVTTIPQIVLAISGNTSLLGLLYNITLNGVMIVLLLHLIKVKRWALYSFFGLQFINAFLLSAIYETDIWDSALVAMILSIVMAILLCLRHNGMSAWQLFFTTKDQVLDVIQNTSARIEDSNDIHGVENASEEQIDDIIFDNETVEKGSNVKSLPTVIPTEANNTQTKRRWVNKKSYFIVGLLTFLFILFFAILKVSNLITSNIKIELGYNKIQEYTKPAEEAYAYLIKEGIVDFSSFFEFMDCMSNEYIVINDSNTAKSLYNALINKGYTTANIGDEKTFISAMEDETNRKELFDMIVNDGYDLGDYDTFNARFKTTRISNDLRKRIISKLILDKYDGLSSEIEVLSYLGFKGCTHTYYFLGQEFYAEIGYLVPFEKKYSTYILKIINDSKISKIPLYKKEEYLLDHPYARPHIRVKIKEESSQSKRRLLYYSLLGSGYISKKELGSISNFLKALDTEEKIKNFYWQLIYYGFATSEIGSEENFFSDISSDLQAIND